MSQHAPVAGNQSFLRRLNASAVLAELRRGGPQTLTEIAQRTHLSRPTVEAAADELSEQGWVEQLAPETGSVGRPARRYRFRSQAGFVLGLDIGAHKIVALLADLDGHIIATRRAQLRTSTPAADRLQKARAVAGDALAVAEISDDDLVAAGVGTPGVIDDSGAVLFTDVLSDWGGDSLATELRTTLPCPVAVENDANLAALAERWRGVAANADDVVYVLVGQRMGAGLLIGGRLHRGHGGAAGEVAFMDQLGLRSAMDGFRKLSRLTHLDGPGDTQPAGQKHAGDVDAAGVFAAVRDGDARARETVDSFTHDLSRGIAAMALTIDPELVVIGGGLSRAGELFLPDLRRHLTELCVRAPRVELSSLGDESVALGALRRALNDADQRLFS